ncbi:VWA domain-containing protein [Candidatus Bipolaricaulota bacterium]|nr:VWA domain-containing protein [Candidatus Bipolaricaulota bacterium]
MRKYSVLVVILISLLFSFSTCLIAAETTSNNIQIILDSSASMAEPVNGVVKINAARNAVKDVLDMMPKSFNVSFRLYSHRYTQQQKQKSCTDTEVILPFQKFSEGMKSTIKDKLSQVKPKGLTPIAYTLKQAVKDFEGMSGENTIILVSDGEETCGGNPFAVANNISALDIGVKVYVIGFDVESKQQLQGIAQRSGGRYYDADNAEELSTVLKEAVQEAAKPPQTQASLPFSDDFEGGMSSAWRTEPVGQLILGAEKGELTIKGELVEDRLLKAFVGNSDWTDYVLSVDIRYDPGSYYSSGTSYPWDRDNRVALFVRAQNQNNMVGFFIQPGGKAGFRIKEYGIWGDMESSGSIPEKKSFNVVLSIKGNKYQAMVDDQKVASLEYSKLESGFVGLQVAVDKELKAYFDNFKVTPIKD